MLGTLDDDQKKDWKRYLGPLTFAYICIRHDTTSYSPFELLFGRQPRLPVDLVLGLEEPGSSVRMPEYAKDLRKCMSQSFELAYKKAREAQHRQKVTCDVRARHAMLDIGDRVLVKILAFEGRHKLSNRWESDVYMVIGQENQDIPVYQLRKESGEGRVRTLHRNHLLPVGSLPIDRDIRKIRPHLAPWVKARANLRSAPAEESVVVHVSSEDSDSDDSNSSCILGEDVSTHISRPPIPD
ncbi:uncharacterized protein LOC132564705 [Ylistrum balloti]|uniref:uncharacterized protein LOC132564705 n=1 Tax=Ylistrum balloti TaxID=509963 RepID=UPI0029058CD5|nr:uncharacterized protein LOC132564705 [Ylistrum balloti]